MLELQSKWIAGVLLGRITLPSKEEMLMDITTFYALLKAQGTPKRYTHYLGITQVRISLTYVSAGETKAELKRVKRFVVVVP